MEEWEGKYVSWKSRCGKVDELNSKHILYNFGILYSAKSGGNTYDIQKYLCIACTNFELPFATRTVVSILSVVAYFYGEVCAYETNYSLRWVMLIRFAREANRKGWDRWGDGAPS